MSVAPTREKAASPGPEIVLIPAVAERNRVIGRGLDLPWHLREDLRRFKRLTMNHVMIMGRRTFEGVLHQFGEPLPGRRILVLTSRGRFKDYPEIESFPSLGSALEAASDAPVIFIGGGARVYEEALAVAHRLELTLVEGDYEGDAYFPEYEHLLGDVFLCTGEEQRDGFRFVTYSRKDAASPSTRR